VVNHSTFKEREFTSGSVVKDYLMIATDGKKYKKLKN